MKRTPALEPLSHDHYEGLRLAARIRRNVEGGEDLVAMPDEITAFWHDHLVRHFTEEEALILPVLEKVAAPLAERMVREHAEIEGLVNALKSQSPDLPSDLLAFADALAAHIRFEEREAFPSVEQHADGSTLATIEQALHSASRAKRPSRNDG